MWKIFRTGGFKNRDKPERVAHQVPRVPGILPPLDKQGVSVTWVGHATTLVRIGGLNILTDPVWSERLPGRSKRMVAPGIAWENLPHIDAVVISHNHYDHLDTATVKRLPATTSFFVPLGLAAWFNRKGITRVTELDWWQSARLGDVEFSLVPAHHWSRRTLTDTCDTLWGGWVFTAGKRRVYFAGDTGYGAWFKEIGAKYPGIDVAILPIGAYAPGWFMRSVHLNPDESVRAMQDLGAPRLASMHWGTFVLSREPLLEPLSRIRNAWREAKLPPHDLWDLAIGETRQLGAK